MCDASHYNSFVLGLTSVDEVCERIVYIPEDITVFF